MKRKELKGDSCIECDGTGEVTIYIGNSQLTSVDCHVCAGTGLVNIQGVCKKCKGGGKVLNEDLSVVYIDYDPRETCEYCNGSGLEPL